MSNPMMEMALKSAINETFIEKIKTDVLEFVNKKEEEHAAALVLVVQKTNDGKDIAFTTFKRTESGALEQAEISYLSQLTKEKALNIIFQ